MGSILVLDEALASQIAAGEVVERPASVVKELLENSLDADARHIDVVLEGGGTDLLVITDDGRGMDAADASLCFSRHATSKLRGIDDLVRIGTFGFRGEALAAISSVAKVRLVTRPPGSEVAHEVLVEGGRITRVGETGAPFGTRVEIKDLFFNVPARRKFLKAPRTEAGHVDAALRTAALGQPSLAFSLTSEGKRVLDVGAAPEGSDLDNPRRLARAVACLGEQVRDELYPFHAESELLSLSGYVVSPLLTRRDLAGVHLSVNGRPVSDRGLLQAVRVAFRTLLEVGRQPICALDLRLDGALVDVNVHPRKAEVRFSEPRRVHGHLIRLLGDFLATTPWLHSRGAVPPRPYVLRAAAGTFKDEPAGDEGDLVSVHRERVRSALERFAERAHAQQTPLFSGPAAPAPTTRPGLGSAGGFASLRVAGQVGLTYLVLDGPDGMVVIDQHAAHERVTFEKLRKAAREGRVRSQPLLFPLTIKLSSLELAALEERGEDLARFGLEAEPFGEGTAVIRAVPYGLEGGRAEAIARDALAELADKGHADSLDDATDAVCARLACHGSVRAGQALAPEEVRALLVQLDAIDLGAHCPHGRPVVRTLPFDEMARWFDRR
jgi:DNA mismatch repair protein MutL